MRRGQEVVSPLPDKDTLDHHVVEEQFQIRRKREPKERAKMHDANRHFLTIKIFIELGSESIGAAIQCLL